MPYHGLEVIHMTLGENLRRLRMEKGLSQEEAAQVLFVSRQSVSKWENNQAEPGVANLRALARLYGVTLDQLLSEESESPEMSGPGEGQSVPASEEKRAGRAYLLWTVALAVWYAVKGVFTMEFYDTVNIPFSAIAMAVGIWVRCPAMWVAAVCLFVIDLAFNVAGLAAGMVTEAAGLAVNGVWLWVLTRPAMRRRFQTKG